MASSQITILLLQEKKKKKKSKGPVNKLRMLLYLLATFSKDV